MCGPAVFVGRRVDVLQSPLETLSTSFRLCVVVTGRVELAGPVSAFGRRGGGGGGSRSGGGGAGWRWREGSTRVGEVACPVDIN